MKQLSVAAPKRPRNLATKGLKGNLPLTLAEEMLKYTVMPNSLAKNHWKIEITELLNQLFFKVSDSSEMTDTGRRIRSTHYPLARVIKEVNDMTADATDALKPYLKKEQLIYPENFADGNLFEYGWELKEEKDGKYLAWILFYKNIKICKVYGD
jgi:hypothetical protein